MTAGEELEAALNRGWSFDELEVYADHLLSKNDPRGDVIAIDLSPRPESQPWVSRRRTAIGAWLGHDMATRAGHLIQHGFLHELRDGMYPAELLDSPAGNYLRGYVAWGRTRVQASIERLARKKRPWLSRLTIANHAEAMLSAELATKLIHATPRLEEITFVGRPAFAAFPHPNVKRCVVDARCFGVDIDVTKERIDAPIDAAGPTLPHDDIELLLELVDLAPDCNQLYMYGADFSEPVPSLVARLAAAQLVELNGPVVRVAIPDLYLGGGQPVEAVQLAGGRGVLRADRGPDIGIDTLGPHAVFLRAALQALPASARSTDVIVDYLNVWRRSYTASMTIDAERVARLRAAFNGLLELHALLPSTSIGDEQDWATLERLVTGLDTEGGATFRRPYDYDWY